MKIENWNGYQIRFVEIHDEWWAVAKDVADALGYAETRNMTKLVPKKYLISSILNGMNAKSTLISEFGIYKAVFGSHKQEAEEFQEWVFRVIKELRQTTGLEGFQVFRMLDKEHQKQAMDEIQKSFTEVSPKDFIKANTIANKAISNEFGYPKLVKKGDMTPEMLRRRQPILEDTVILMSAKEKFDLPISVSKEVYKKVEKQ
ncbi:BRO-N domain-containing protein [Enterococcus sp. AZ007]|uniref:BRO-N domain-containing protein n=1 Tax=Enterococcus sp. AZ007 TaxID=2774839 RepID=UPI003F27B1CE